MQQFMFGTWTVNRTLLSTREDGVVVFDVEQNNTTIDFAEDGTLTWDRNFIQDTLIWFYVPDPETVLVGNYFGGQSLLSADGIYANTFEVRDRTPERFVLYEEHVIQDTLDRDILVTETWEVLK
ncbi:MAG: hypothetical protein AAF840_12380 [Bacteroidota bacterium]